jgi:hypothetical protein
MATAKKTVTPNTEAPTKRPATKPAVAKPVAATSAPKKSVSVKPKPTAKKLTTTTTTAPAPAKKASAPKKAPATPKPAIDLAQRNNYVEVAAFYIAERRGFAAANPTDDWIAAEAEIDRLIASGHFGS